MRNGAADQTRNVEPMLEQCLSTVCDVDPSLANIQCFFQGGGSIWLCYQLDYIGVMEMYGGAIWQCMACPDPLSDSHIDVDENCPDELK